MLSAGGEPRPRHLRPGWILGPVGGDWWRYLAAPFIYPDIGYLFVASVGIAIFGVPVEQRLGTVPTAVLIVACGALGMLAADAMETAFAPSNDLLYAAGGNGIALGLLACWAVIRGAEVRSRPGEHVEVIGAAIAAAVLILLPIVDDFANVFAGLGGAAGGGRLRPRRLYARRERRPASRRLAADKFISITPELHRYAVEHSSFRDGVVPEVERAAEDMGDLAAMQIAGDQAAFMTILVAAIGAQRRARGRHLPRLRSDRDRARAPRGRQAGLLRARRGVRRARPRAPREGRPGRPGRDPGRSGARDACGRWTPRAVRLRLHRRGQDRATSTTSRRPSRDCGRTG